MIRQRSTKNWAHMLTVSGPYGRPYRLKADRQKSCGICFLKFDNITSNASMLVLNGF